MTWRAVACAIAMAYGAIAQAGVLTQEEQAWVRAHPVVRYAIDPYWPIEYYDSKGRHQGLTREYIDHIERTTGLVFEAVPSQDLQHSLQMMEQGELQAISAASVRLLDDAMRYRLLFSDPYFVGASVIITKAASPIAYSPAKLKGLRVAVKGGAGYERYLRRNYPSIQLLLLNDPEAALAAVDEGLADAAIGLDQVLRPVIRRKYFDQLHLSGIIADMPAIVAMGVTPTEPMLRDIINKALASLTSRETDLMEARWIAGTDFGAPSWPSVFHYYRWELLGLTGCVLLLAAFARQAVMARRSAQRSEGVKAAFLAMMSHEIRTPMNAILSSIELLQRTPLGPHQEQLAAMAGNSAVNLLELLDNVLDLSRLEAKRVTLDARPTDLWALAETVAQVHRAGAMAKGVLLQLHCEGPPQPMVLIDAVRLRQILNNLLSNAVKFTAQGRIDLYLEVQAEVLPLRPLTLTLKVCDTGVGIPAGKQNQLFQPFVQADSATNRRYGGSGLGLAICRDLTVLMGGDISLASVPGQGTQVQVTLPVAHVDAVPAPCEPAPAPALGTLPTADAPAVLLVEDHPVNQQAIGLQLEALGYRYQLAEDGPAALAALTLPHTFAAVLLDCQLPGMDGYDVARHIRALEERNNRERLPVLAISAANDDLHRSRVFDSDMDGSLSKPLKLAELQALLALWVPPPGLPEKTEPPQALRALFLDSTQADLLELEAAIGEGDRLRATQRAHRIRGAALMVGATELAVLAGEWEDAAPDTPPTPADLAKLRAALTRYANA